MKINFIVSKSMNHFFFVQNLSEWHFSCCKYYNEDWLRETGPLNGEEIKALTALKETLQKYGFRKFDNTKAFNIFNYLLRYEELKDEKDILAELELETYQGAMDVMEPRFEKIWNEQNRNFTNVQKKLTKNFRLTEDQILGDLKTLFVEADFKEEVNIILLLSTGAKGSGGGANNGPNAITLECSSMEEKYINIKLSVLWHEITHNILRKYTEQLVDILDKNPTIIKASDDAKKRDFGYSKELFIHSIFTDISFMTCKYFSTGPCANLRRAIEENNSKWLCYSRKTFPTYLMYLIGQSMEEKLDKKEAIAVKEMADIIVKSHKLTEKYFKDHSEKVIWFSYN